MTRHKILFGIASAVIGAVTVISSGQSASIAHQRFDESPTSSDASPNRTTDATATSGRPRRLRHRFSRKAKSYLNPIFRPP